MVTDQGQGMLHFGDQLQVAGLPILLGHDVIHAAGDQGNLCRGWPLSDVGDVESMEHVGGDFQLLLKQRHGFLDVDPSDVAIAFGVVGQSIF